MLSTQERANFAVISRLVSCLVTERILPAFYIPFQQHVNGAEGLMVVLSSYTISDDINSYRRYRFKDIFVMIPLRHPPVFRDSQDRKHGRLVSLVDPLEMLPTVYEFGNGNHDVNDIFVEHILDCLQPPSWDLVYRQRLLRASDPVTLWRNLAEGLVIPEDVSESIGFELQSSRDWQALAYTSPPVCPTLLSSAIEWEQSLVTGHPTHPMHRARMFPSNYTTIKNPMSYDWYHPKIRFVRVPASQLNLRGPFKSISQKMVTRALDRADRKLEDREDSVYMPTHELQINNIAAKFENVEILDPEIYLPALAQSSIRTVILPDFPDLALKLAVGVKISSSLRTISHFTANFGPRFSEEVVPKLRIDSSILAIELEPSSAVYQASDPDIAKHFTAVIREQFIPPDGEAVVVVAALLETDHFNVGGVSALQHALRLDSEQKREVFLDNYIRVACEALIPALIHNGVAFEAHAQNVLVRLHKESGDVRGFVLRDLGGLRIYPPILRESTGVDFQFLPKHCIATETHQDIFPKFYHTFVHNHIQRLIRVLGLHHNGRGWDILRKHMSSLIPENHLAWKLWMDTTCAEVESKCLMRMRMRDSYRDMVYSPYPNMIQYRSGGYYC